MEIMCYLLMIFFIFMFSFSTNFMFCWMLMEASTLIYLSLICFQNINQKFMAVCSYFLIQVFSSSLFLLSMSMMYDNTKLYMLGLLMYNISLSMKMGLFPFYKWMVSLVFSMNWFSIGLLATYQKFMPLVMLSLNFFYYYYMLISIISLLVSIYYSLGLYSVKLIFSYSMLSNSTWISLMLLSSNWWLLYYVLYSILFMIICFFNFIYNIEDVMDFNFLSNCSKFVLLMYLLNLISLSGMPPFTGFLFKFLMIDLFTESFFYIYLYLLVMCSLVHFYLYVRLILLCLIMYSGKSKFLVCYNWFKMNYMYMYMFTFFVNVFIFFLGLKLMI